MRFNSLSTRTQIIFREIVDAWLEKGEPIGSRAPQPLKRKRTVTSLNPQRPRRPRRHGFIGRSPQIRRQNAHAHRAALLHRRTHGGRRNLSQRRGQLMERSLQNSAAIENVHAIEPVLENISLRLSGLTRHVSIVMAPKNDIPWRHVDFIPLIPRTRARRAGRRKRRHRKPTRPHG